MAKKPKANPQLNYRVEKQVQDEYKKACKENYLDPGALIRQFMLDIIEKYKKVLTVSEGHDTINNVRENKFLKGGNKNEKRHDKKIG